MGNFDILDMRLIDILQKDASNSLLAIGEEIGLSQNACWRRIQKMEVGGLLKTRVTLFDAQKLGFGLVVFAVLRVSEQLTNRFA